MPSPRSPEGADGLPYVAPPAPGLVDSPVFVLSSVRSGSTLPRVLLNSHSQIRAPHETHPRTVHVHLSRDFTAEAMRALGLDKDELEHALWDRPRLHRCWPSARWYRVAVRTGPAPGQERASNRAAAPPGDWSDTWGYPTA
ncbi:sulfotransferase [Streptomyces mirabilis]|uniref:sulfotransferase n=1 Tax=Streptomyces mirabilis TaxID=68239 RepID=UPI0036EC29F4